VCSPEYSSEAHHEHSFNEHPPLSLQNYNLQKAITLPQFSDNPFSCSRHSSSKIISVSPFTSPPCNPSFTPTYKAFHCHMVPFPLWWGTFTPISLPVEGLGDILRRLTSSTRVICMILKRSLPTHVIKSRVGKLKEIFSKNIWAPWYETMPAPCHMGSLMAPIAHAACCVAPALD